MPGFETGGRRFNSQSMGTGFTTAALPEDLTVQTFQYSATPATPLRRESRIVHQNSRGNPAKQKAFFSS